MTISEGAPVGREVARLLASDPDASSLLVYRLDYNRSEARREDGSLVSIADWQAGQRAILTTLKEMGTFCDIYADAPYIRPDNPTFLYPVGYPVIGQVRYQVKYAAKSLYL